MILEIEDPREARSGPALLGPVAIGILVVDEIPHSPLSLGRVRLAGGDKPHQSPGCLGGRGLSLAREGCIIVGPAALSPAAILVLVIFQERDRVTNIVLIGVDANRHETLQRLPGTVDVVDPPAAVPGSVILLGVLQVPHSTPDRFIYPGIIETTLRAPQHFQYAAGDVGAGRVQHGVVIGIGDLVENLTLNIRVKSRPASIGALEA